MKFRRHMSICKNCKYNGDTCNHPDYGEDCTPVFNKDVFTNPTFTCLCPLNWDFEYK